MNKLTIDLESRSRVDIRKVGASVYSRHESTEVLMVAVKWNSNPTRIWILDRFREEVGGLSLCSKETINKAIRKADIIEAHNVAFEKTMWDNIMVKRHGFENLPFMKLRCSAAKAAAHSLPRSLEGVGEALGLDIQKDKGGHKLMLQMCKPRKPSKSNPSEWFEDPERILKLAKYCIQDVESEYAVSEHLAELSKDELKIWRLDQMINARGIHADVESAKAVVKAIELESTELLDRVYVLTDAQVSSVRQVAATLKWLAGKGVRMKDLQADTVKRRLRTLRPCPARELLEIRRALSLSSTSKYSAMINRADEDQRIRGTLMYHGAGTGRWTGKGIQPQNLPRGEFKQVDACLSMFREGSLDMIEFLFDGIMPAASTCIRGILSAPEGRKLYCADFASIEGIVLAWLTSDKKALKTYKNHMAYESAAAAIFGMRPEDVTKGSQERQVGKTAELACGYQGGAGAFQSLASKFGVHVSDERADEIKIAWRKGRPLCVKFWKDVETAAIKAVRFPGISQKCGKVTFHCDGEFLRCFLPSGRAIHYYKPSIRKGFTPWGKEADKLFFWGVDPYTRKWCEKDTYGGKLTENIVQAIARDLMAHGMVNAERAGYLVVLTVHDEILSETREDFGSLEEFVKLMCDAPDWAKGCPVMAEGWEGRRYRK